MELVAAGAASFGGASFVGVLAAAGKEVPGRTYNVGGRNYAVYGEKPTAAKNH